MKIARRWMITAGLLCSTASVALAQPVVLGGNPPGSLWYAQSQAIAATVNKHSKLRIDVLPQGGSSFFPMFQSREVDMGIANPIEALFASRAVWPFEGANGGKGYAMTTIMLGSPIRLSMITTPDSGIKTLADLRGKRVVVNYGAFSGATLTARSALANAGLTPDDVVPVNVTSYPEGVRAIMEGRADAAVASLGSGILQELEVAKGAVMLAADPSPEAMARTQKVGPAFIAFEEKAPSVGVKPGMVTLSYSTTVVARPDLSGDVVKAFIGTLWDHHKELPTITKTLTTWTPDRFASTAAVLPYHPAAIEFYKAKGVWTPAMDARQAELSAKR
jgi:TRAP transporter TAXI family solute receptor